MIAVTVTIPEIGKVRKFVSPDEAHLRTTLAKPCYGDPATRTVETTVVDPTPRLLAAVNTERARRLSELVVEVAGIAYDADPSSRDNLGGLLTADGAGVPVPWPIPWRCTDDAVRPLGHADAVALSAAILLAIQSVYAASWALKDEIIPALSPAEAEAFDVTAAEYWPG